MRDPSPVPTSRLSRLMHLGRLGSGIAGAAMGEGLRQLSKGKRPVAADLLLTPGNAVRLSEGLSRMRGAAMKLGQLMSMEAGDLLPEPLPEILSGLRDNAHAMPLGQVAQVLDDAWGPGWNTRFKRFNFTPCAAASIGQVHEAETKDGRRLAIKVQYPGIARSIDSDLDNVAGLLRTFRLLPAGLEIEPLLEQAKVQLRMEADYLFEAEQLRAYRAAIGNRSGLRVPYVAEDLTTRTVLAMEFIDGAPIESLTTASPEVRDRVGSRLLELALCELFDWRLAQTDPNFANFRYRAEEDELVLLDFGATKHYAPDQVESLRLLLAAAHGEDDGATAAAAERVGYMASGDPAGYRKAVVDLLATVTAPTRQPGCYDFAQSNLSERLGAQVLSLRVEQGFGRLPPPDILYLHRKLGGLYLLLKRLTARVPVSALVAPYLQLAP